MSAGKGDLCAVLHHEDVTHQIDNARMPDVFEVDDAIAPGTKELCSVKPLFAVPKRTTDEHGGADPVDAAIVSFRFQAQQVRHSKDAALDVVGEDHEIVVAERSVASEFVKSLLRLRLTAIRVLDRSDANPAFPRRVSVFGGADSFSDIFRLHGI